MMPVSIVVSELPEYATALKSLNTTKLNEFAAVDVYAVVVVVALLDDPSVFAPRGSTCPHP
jgi:hypothetical protein